MGKGQVTVERKVSFHPTHTVKRLPIWKITVGIDLTYNIGRVNNLVIWKKCVRTRTSNNKTNGQSG